ncbi:hypothetical protein HYX07_01745 [Candidatus Woesearchaeota archaeon]|nr:hypothetical protein [Candidatus Woesearchaeota archaeon]
MNIPEGLKLEFLLRFSGSGDIVKKLAQGIRDKDKSITPDLIRLVDKTYEFYYNKYFDGDGDANLGHMGYTYIAIGNHAELTMGRAKALPIFYEAFRAFNLLGSKARYSECEALLEQYPELKQSPRKYPEVQSYLKYIKLMASVAKAPQ